MVCMVLNFLGDELAIYAWAIGGSIAFLLLFVAGLAGATAAAYDRALEAVQRGEYLNHWTYEPGEWRRFTEAQFSRPKLPVLVSVIVGLVGGGLAGGFVGPGLLRATFWGAALGALLGALAGGLLLGAVHVVWRWADRARYHATLSRTGEAVVTQEGLYFDGTFHAWSEVDRSSDTNKVLPGNPSVLQVGLREDGGGPTPWAVPVPAGREEEAWDVLVRLVRGGGRRNDAAGPTRAPASRPASSARRRARRRRRSEGTAS
jgi:hypothetical protein